MITPDNAKTFNGALPIYDSDLLPDKSKNKNSPIKKNKCIPWVEKYRPNNLNDIIQQDDIIKVFKKTLETGELPHLLLHGSPGTGKTSTILSAAIQLFGPNKIEERVIELNASDDRGIGIVRNYIIKFSKIALGTSDPNYPSPPFKLVILDEADSMTPEAQSALRKVMESMSNITRFCFICNYVNKIIMPIASRCMKFRFKPISPKAISEKLVFIANKENLDINLKCIHKIASIADGDARRAIMILQNLKYININIKIENIKRITGNVNNNKLKKLYKKCISGTICEINNIVSQIYQYGYQIQNILLYLKDIIINTNIPDKKKSKILLELCLTDRNLIELCDERIELLNLLCFINITIKN